MSVTITVEEAQAHLKEFIDNLAPGEELVITEGQRPLAKSVGQGVATPEASPRRQREGKTRHYQGGRRAPEGLRGVHGVRLLLARLDPELAAGWSDEEVMRRWGGLFPPHNKSRQALPISNDWVKWRLKDAAWVAKARQRLQNLCWFMTCRRSRCRGVPTVKSRPEERSSRAPSRAWR